ncbi:MAG: DUF5333 family protein [Sulfitobacter sp.]
MALAAGAVLRRLSLCCGAVLCAAEVGAEGKAPAPEFSVEMNFQSIMAQQLADGCDMLAFDHAGYDRHFTALIGKFDAQGIHSRNISEKFAQIDPERYRPHFSAFVTKYDLKEESPDGDFCDAGAAEAKRGTPIGQMLKVVAE